MDGNGRWASRRGLPRLAGHERGAHAVGQCLEACRDSGIKYLTLFAFSSENWKRPQQEIDGLMTLLKRFLDERTPEIVEKGICLRTIGRVNDLPPDVVSRLDVAREKSSGNNSLTVILALNYSGRTELTDAVRRIASRVRQGEIELGAIDEAAISDHLDTAGIPDPDLLIRTSGEMRISNFLLWQMSYTEIYVTQKLWPDFTKEDFFAALADYQTRQRRFGGI